MTRMTSGRPPASASGMASGNAIAEIAAVIGSPARANILAALMDTRAFTASELAWHAGVGAPSTSAHLAKLVDAGLVCVVRQGRNRYYRLASAQVAAAVETLMALAAISPPRYRPTGPKDAALRAARTCYDHLAGRLGTGIADALQARDQIRVGDGGVLITPSGSALFADFGVTLPEQARSRPLCRTCLDWSERRPHLAGRLGAGLSARCFELGWIARTRDSRAVTITPAGAAGFEAVFGVSAADGGGA